MAYPTIRVEAAFTVGTTAAFILDDAVKGLLNTATLSNEVWTDITAYASAFTVRRGASRAEGPVLRFEAGTLSLTLDNSDRRFDPTNTSGPYVSVGVSQVTPMRQVRILAEWAGVSYPIFTGYADSWDISYDEPAMSTCVLTATDATKVLSDFDRVALGSAVGAGELSGARVNRVLDSVSWPVGQRDIDSGDSALQGTTMDRSAWEELLRVQDSEIGHLYIDGRGYVVFRERSANMSDSRSTTVQAAFGDASGELPFVDHTIVYDDDGLANLVRIANAGGTQQTAQDTASQQQYLTHTHERTDLLLQTDAEAANYAAFVLHQSKEPELRFTELTVAGHDDVALYPHMLGREFGDLITLTRRPPGGGPVTTRRCFIVGVTHTVPGPDEWTTTWSLQSATKWAFLTLDHTALGVLDSNALAY
jgi:hypothetical protein